MSLRGMYRKPLEGNKPTGVRISITYQDGNGLDVNYVPAGITERYGTNPNQLFALLVPEESSFRLREVKTGKGGFSLTNIEDAYWAAELLKYMKEPSAAIMKHLNPSGAAQSDNLAKSFLRAWYCDFVSAFGGVAGFNQSVDKETAEVMTQRLPDGSFRYYIEVIAAPDFDEGVMDILQRRKDVRVVKYEGLDEMPRYAGDVALPVVKSVGDVQGMLALEDRYLTRMRKPEDLLLAELKKGYETITGIGVVTQKQPTQREIEDLLFAWYVAGVLRSNSVAIVKNGCTISCGTGKQARNFAVEDAIEKTRRLRFEALGQDISEYRNSISDYSLEGAVAASEALFPEPDSVYTLADAGIKVFAETGGSVKDSEIIRAANEKGMSGIFTGERWFSHH